MKILQVRTNKPDNTDNNYICIGDIVQGISFSDLFEGEQAIVLRIEKRVYEIENSDNTMSDYWAAVKIIKSNNQNCLGIKMMCFASSLRKVD